MEGHGGTLFFYVPVLLFGFFPWSGFFPVALHQALKDWKQYRSGEKKPEAEHGLALFAGLWCVGIFIFFSLSATRLPHYLFALFPAASILTTLYWSRCLREPSPPGLTVSIRTILISGYVFGIALAAAPAIYKMFVNTIAKEFPAAAHVEPGLMPVIMGAIVLIGVIGMRRLAFSEEKRPATFWVGGGMIASMALVAIIFGLPKFSTFFIAPPQELATIAGFNLGPDDRLIQFGNKRPSLVFYAKRKVYQISPGEDERFEPHLNSPGRKMVILQSHLRSKLPGPVADWPVVLERHGFSLLSSEAVVTR
jgi:hypothetical protein